MAFHQGELGTWNFIIVLITALALTFLCIAGLLSYLKRKRTGDWGLPAVSKNIKFGLPVLAIVVILGIILPLFGLSVILIFSLEFVFNKIEKKQMKPVKKRRQ